MVHQVGHRELWAAGAPVVPVAAGVPQLPGLSHRCPFGVVAQLVSEWERLPALPLQRLAMSHSLCRGGLVAA